MKKIPIDESILNEVKALYTSAMDKAQKVSILKQKISIEREKMWLLISEKMPETIRDNYTLNSDDWTVSKIEDTPSPMEMLKKMLGGE
jgi:hypothetical protein